MAADGHLNWKRRCPPVCRQPRGYISSRDLRHDVAPEKRSVDHSHYLWVPVELGFLSIVKDKKKKKELESAKMVAILFCAIPEQWCIRFDIHG